MLSGVDDIDLRAIDTNSALAGNQAFAFSGTVARAHSVWSVDVGEHLLIRGDVNGDARPDFEIMLLETSVVRAADFLL